MMTAAGPATNNPSGRIAKPNKTLAALRPIIVVKERANGLGMQLRLVVGPFNDAAAAAKICASLSESGRPCETSVFDGQRLAFQAEPAKAEQAKGEQAAAPPPAATRPTRRRTSQRAKPIELQVEKPAEPEPKPRSSLQTFLGLR